jgi:hypothetical protein
MPVHGNFDKIIHQQLARSKENSKFKQLKRLEQSMEPLPKNRPRVLMEPDKMEYDYPETRKYNYVRPNSRDEDEMLAPDAQERHFPRSELPIPKRRTTKIADKPSPKSESLDDAHKRIMEDLRMGAFDALSIYKGQNNPGKPGGKKN